MREGYVSFWWKLYERVVETKQLSDLQIVKWMSRTVFFLFFSFLFLLIARLYTIMKKPNKDIFKVWRNYFQNGNLKTKMKTSCHIWVRANQSSYTCLDQVQKLLYGIIGDELISGPSNKQYHVSLMPWYRYFRGQCSGGLNSLIQPALASAAVTSRTFAHKKVSSPFFS